MNTPIGEPSLALPGVQFHDLSNDDFHRTSPLRSKRNSLGALHNRQHENQFGYGKFVIETSGFDLSDQALTTEQPRHFFFFLFPLTRHVLVMPFYCHKHQSHLLDLT